MNYKEFIIKNYKGISTLRLDLTIQPDNKIITLIGLNESGKTTILEAINDFEYPVSESLRHLLIPKNFAGGFTDRVSIKAKLQFSNDDKEKIKNFLKEQKIKAKEIIVRDEIELERVYEFENSKPILTKMFYSPFVFLIKRARGKESSLDDVTFSNLYDYIEKAMFPEIIFYRDFLSKFPEKIYLESSDENIKEKEYSSIIEDVLVSINPAYDIKTSLLDRLKNMNSANKQALEAVENEMGAKISKVVFDAWSKIQDISKKEIIVKTDSENGRFYIKLSIKDGVHSYALSERSLGFRWFFTFLLFTEFRKERIKTSGEILFLLDEPASNLHQAAQKSLLETFEKITKKSRLVYTTHSHHLINPIWLDSAYVVRNKGLQYKEKEDEDYNLTKTDIEAYKCKQFISNYPTQTSYFQPILDVLDYQPGLLECVPSIVINEGKFDYFVFTFFKEIVFCNTSEDWRFYPGHGATQLDLPIALYESWGRKYIVILDSDKEGRAQKKRYINELSDEYRIFTLHDIDSSFDNFTPEMLFNGEEKIQICREFNESLTEFDKSAFNSGIKVLYAKKISPEYISDTTKKKFEKIMTFIKTKLEL